MKLICKICGKEMNIQHCQQGHCHFNCFNEQITVYKIYMVDDKNLSSNYYVEKDPLKILGGIECLSEQDDNNGIAIIVGTMAHGEYINLPDFLGF